MSLVRRHPIGLFLGLAFALSWLLESPLVFFPDSITGAQGFILVILASSVPSVLAIVLTAAGSGKGAVRVLLRRLLAWRVDPRWYVLIFLGPLALAAIAVGLNAVVGGPGVSLGTPLAAIVITLLFSIFPGSALGEEIGWRGYLLPRLQAGRSALTASLVLGAFWGLWHLPLWLTGDPVRTPGLYAAFFVSVLALSVILAWVYNGTGGSLVTVVLLHATANLPVSLAIDGMGTDATVPVLLYFGLLVVVAIVVVLVAGPAQLSRSRERQIQPGAGQ